jgi:hypothetical protein
MNQRICVDHLQRTGRRQGRFGRPSARLRRHQAQKRTQPLAAPKQAVPHRQRQPRRAQRRGRPVHLRQITRQRLIHSPTGPVQILFQPRRLGRSRRRTRHGPRRHHARAACRWQSASPHRSPSRGTIATTGRPPRLSSQGDVIVDFPPAKVYMRPTKTLQDKVGLGALHGIITAARGQWIDSGEPDGVSSGKMRTLESRQTSVVGFSEWISVAERGATAGQRGGRPAIGVTSPGSAEAVGRASKGAVEGLP